MNNILTVILSVFVGVLAGVSLLLGINNTVINANVPLFSQINEVANNQSNVEKKIEALGEKITKQQELTQALLAKVDNMATVVQRPVAAVAQQPTPQQPPTEDLNKVYDIPVGKSPIIGKKDAPVTIVMFTDLECPFCHRFYPGVKETLQNYPDKVRLIMKNFPLPFHPKARPAAKLAFAANEQGKYKEMMEILMENSADYSEAKVKEYAQKIGLNYNRLMADFKNNDAKYEAMIEEDMKLVESSDVRGTPSFFVNGKKVMVRDAAGYKDLIDKL